MAPSNHTEYDLATRIGDRTGLFASLACAVHCALLPLLLGLFPALGIGFFLSADIDQAFSLFAGLLGVFTLSLGYRRHRVFHAWALMLPGLALLWIGSFTALHDHSLSHAALMTSGGLLVAGAHFLNLRLTHAQARVAQPLTP